MKKISKAFNQINDIKMIAKNGIILIKDLVKGYINNSETDEGGVSSMDGKLNIRPRYQRAYIADMTPNWRQNLINSVLCGFPINRIYLGVESFLEDGIYEVMDGQQRIITLCDFYFGNFSIKIDGIPYKFENLDIELQEKFLNYALDVTYCMGTEDERIKWFKRINQPNSILTDQEIRNSTYVGTWVESAKKYFSSVGSKAKNLIMKKDYPYYVMNYCKDKHIERGEILEMAIDWIAYKKYEDLRKKKDMDERICNYMAENQNKENADELIAYYKEVIDWIKKTFGTKAENAMKKVEWGRIYAEYGDKEYDLTKLNQRVACLMSDTEVTCNSAIYEFVLMGEPMDKISMLDLRTFTERDKETQIKIQKGYDPISMKPLEDKTNAHHIFPWAMGGKTEMSNLIIVNEDTHKLIHQGFYNPNEVKQKLAEWVSKI